MAYKDLEKRKLKVKEYQKKYRLKNKEKIKLQKQKYWREKTEYIKQLIKQYS